LHRRVSQKEFVTRGWPRVSFSQVHATNSLPDEVATLEVPGSALLEVLKVTESAWHLFSLLVFLVFLLVFLVFSSLVYLFSWQLFTPSAK